MARMAAARRWGRRTDVRIAVGLGGGWTAEREARQVEALTALAADSRLMALLESWITAVLAAGRSSWVRRASGGMIDADLSGRIRLAGWSLVIAVITHVLLFLVFGMTVTWIGWSTRIVLLAFGLSLFWKPRPWASAWLDR